MSNELKKILEDKVISNLQSMFAGATDDEAKEIHDGVIHYLDSRNIDWAKQHYLTQEIAKTKLQLEKLELERLENELQTEDRTAWYKRKRV